MTFFNDFGMPFRRAKAKKMPAAEGAGQLNRCCQWQKGQLSAPFFSFLDKSAGGGYNRSN